MGEPEGRWRTSEGCSGAPDSDIPSEGVENFFQPRVLFLGIGNSTTTRIRRTNTGSMFSF